MYIDSGLYHIFMNDLNNMTDLRIGDEIYFKDIKTHHRMTSKKKIEVTNKTKYIHILIYYCFQSDMLTMIYFERNL